MTQIYNYQVGNQVIVDAVVDKKNPPKEKRPVIICKVIAVKGVMKRQVLTLVTTDPTRQGEMKGDGIYPYDEVTPDGVVAILK